MRNTLVLFLAAGFLVILVAGVAQAYPSRNGDCNLCHNETTGGELELLNTDGVDAGLGVYEVPAGGSTTLTFNVLSAGNRDFAYLALERLDTMNEDLVWSERLYTPDELWSGERQGHYYIGDYGVYYSNRVAEADEDLPAAYDFNLGVDASVVPGDYLLTIHMAGGEPTETFGGDPDDEPIPSWNTEQDFILRVGEPIPEPSTIAMLLALAGGGIAMVVRRKVRLQKVALLLAAALVVGSFAGVAEAYPHYVGDCFRCHDGDMNSSEVSGNDDTLDITDDDGIVTTYKVFDVDPGGSTTFTFDTSAYGMHFVTLHRLDDTSEMYTPRKYTPDASWETVGWDGNLFIDGFRQYYVSEMQFAPSSLTYDVTLDADVEPDLYFLELIAAGGNPRAGLDWSQREEFILRVGGGGTAPAPVPEPSTLAMLLAIALGGAAMVIRRKRKA